MVRQPSVVVNEMTFTRDMCIDAMRVLAKESQTGTVTRTKFREDGTIPEAAWTKIFGSYAEYQKQAGLKTTRTGQKLLNEIAKQASVDHLRELSETRKQFGDKYIKDKGRRIKTIVGLSDLHDVDCDPFYVRVALDTLRRIEPDIVCLAGDIFDCTEFGKYPVDIRTWSPSSRFKYGLDLIRQFREAAPNAQIDLIEGNHEARLLKYFADQAEELRDFLFGYHNMDLQKLFRLDEYEVNYVSQCDLTTFTETQSRKGIEAANWRCYDNALLVHHHPEGRRQGIPGFNGHHHRHEVLTEHNFLRGSFQWHQLGAGHTRSAEYCEGGKWNNGFIYAHYDTMTYNVTFNYVDIGPVHAEVGGKFYYRREDEVYQALRNEYARRKLDLCLIKE